MRALLEKDPAKRLGSGAKGSAAVQAHPFFRSINWDLLYSRKARTGICSEHACVWMVLGRDPVHRCPQSSDPLQNVGRSHPLLRRANPVVARVKGR